MRKGFGFFFSPAVAAGRNLPVGCSVTNLATARARRLRSPPAQPAATMSDSKAASESYSREAIVAMLLFSLAASSLLLVNKMVMHAIPLPSFVSTLQFVVTAIASYTVMWTGHAPIEKWEWPKVKAYLYYVGLFVGAIYCNMKALQYSNVETVIVFRACCPIVVSLIDWAFLGRMLPSARSWLALAVLLGGCLGYVLTDRAFRCNVMEHAWPR